MVLLLLETIFSFNLVRSLGDSSYVWPILYKSTVSVVEVHECLRQLPQLGHSRFNMSQ